MIEFSNKKGFHGIHTFYGSSDMKNYPIELMNFASVDILEDLSNHFNMHTVLYDAENLPEKHLIEIFYSLRDKIYLPFQVRRPSTRELFLKVFRLVPVTSQLLVPLEMMADQYEDYIDNALLSFIHNVADPIRYTSNVNVSQLIKRIEDLAMIITSQVDNIRNRSFHFNRLILPLVHFAKLKKQISESIVIENITNDNISYSFNYPVEIRAEDLAYFLSNVIME
jgi:hypothetical protein